MSLKEKPVIVFLSGVVTAFIAGILGWNYLFNQIDTRIADFLEKNKYPLPYNVEELQMSQVDTRIASFLEKNKYPLPYKIETLRLDNIMDYFPKGIIIPWYDKTLDIPKGWAVCDGSRGTPDLRGRFLMGVSDAADIGKEGGKNEIEKRDTEGHPLTIEEMPEHRHRIKARRWYLYSGGQKTAWNDTLGHDTFSETEPKGNGRPHKHEIPKHDNRPEFVSVIFIMKL